MKGKKYSRLSQQVLPGRRSTTVLVSAIFAGSILASCSSNAKDTDNDAPNDTGNDQSSIGPFKGGVVTAAHPLAAEAGAKVLQNGGNAIDAAVVTQFVLNVVEPTSSGIGGGGFMGIYKPEEDRVFYIDSREKAPAAATPTQFLQCEPDCIGGEGYADRLGVTSAESGEFTAASFTEIATSGIGVGVPGTLLGAAQALADHGTMELADALAPAITLAEEGFAINARLAGLTDSARTNAWPETAAKFRTEAGDPLSEGFLLVQPDLAKTFRLIAENGVSAFYTGEVAEAIVNAQLRSRAEVGPKGAGRMSLQDLSDYLADFNAGGIDVRDPIVTDYRGYEIYGMPPPSSGGLTVGQILECLETFDIGNAEAGFGSGSASTLHVMIESMRLAFSSRSVWMGDTDFVALPLAGLLNADYLQERCTLISADTRIEDDAIVPGDPRLFDNDFIVQNEADVTNATEGTVGIDTTHFTVIDANGNVVTWTSTIEGTWGSGMTVPGYGFLLNNELTDFNFGPQQTEVTAEDFKPGANDAAPGKRPRSSMAPTMIFKDDNFVAAYGSPGGSTIINSVVNITVNLIDHGMSVQEAIDASRVSATGGSVSYEAFDEATLEALRELGHTLRDEPGDIGSVQAVVVDETSGEVSAGADSRRAGTVAGIQ